jgi:hypothetical protein
MSLEELEQELARLEGMNKSLAGRSVANLKKRLEIDL